MELFVLYTPIYKGELFMKRIFVLLVCLLVIGFSPTAFAAEEDNVLPAPNSSNFTSYSAAIDVTSSRILCQTYSALVKPMSQSISMYLEKWNGNSWISVTSWSTSSRSFVLEFDKSYSRSPGKYRVKGKHIASGETRYSYSPTKIIY